MDDNDKSIIRVCIELNNTNYNNTNINIISKHSLCLFHSIL